MLLDKIRFIPTSLWLMLTLRLKMRPTPPLNVLGLLHAHQRPVTARSQHPSSFFFGFTRRFTIYILNYWTIIRWINMVPPLMITADEVNCLIHAYFEDSGESRFSTVPHQYLPVTRIPAQCLRSSCRRAT